MSGDAGMLHPCKHLQAIPASASAIIQVAGPWCFRRRLFSTEIPVAPRRLNLAPVTMNLVVVFRTAAIGSLMLALLGAGVDLLPGMVPEDLDAAAFDTEAAGQLLILALAALAVGVAGLVATIGLVLFQSWSRLFAVVSTAASLALYPFTPAMAQSGWASMFFYLSAFAWGAAIAMAYFSPLSDRFVRGSSAGSEYRH